MIIKIKMDEREIVYNIVFKYNSQEVYFKLIFYNKRKFYFIF